MTPRSQRCLLARPNVLEVLRPPRSVGPCLLIFPVIAAAAEFRSPLAGDGQWRCERRRRGQELGCQASDPFAPDESAGADFGHGSLDEGAGACSDLNPTQTVTSLHTKAEASAHLLSLRTQVIWIFRIASLVFLAVCSHEEYDTESPECYHGSISLTILSLFFALVHIVAHWSRKSPEKVWRVKVPRRMRMIRERLQNREKLQILKLLRHGIRAIREQSPPEAPSEAAAEVKTQDNDQDDAAKIMLDSSEIREKRNSVLGGEGVAVAEIIASLCAAVDLFVTPLVSINVQLRYALVISSGFALLGKLEKIYGVDPKRLDREGFRRLQRSFFLINTTILHYTVFSSLILFVVAILMTKFVGKNPIFRDADTGEGAENEELWGTVGWSLLSLFQMSTMDWGDIARASIVKFPWLAPFYIVFLLYMGFAVSNIFIALISSQYAVSEGEELERRRRERRRKTGRPVFDVQYALLHNQREMDLLRSDVRSILAVLQKQNAESAKDEKAHHNAKGEGTGAAKQESPDVVLDAATFFNRVIKEKDLAWGAFVIENLPDDNEEDDLQHGNNEERKVELLGTPDLKGKTPLHLAAQAGNEDGVEFLLRQDADKTLEDWDELDSVAKAKKEKESGRPVQGKTALQLAKEGNHGRVAEKIKDWISRASVSQPDQDAALRLLWKNSRALLDAKDKEAVAKLLRAKAKVNVSDDRGRTPLHNAAERDDVSSTQQLVDNKIDRVNKESKDKVTAKTPPHLSQLAVADDPAKLCRMETLRSISPL
jgi:hypothetical protein